MLTRLNKLKKNQRNIRKRSKRNLKRRKRKKRLPISINKPTREKNIHLSKKPLTMRIMNKIGRMYKTLKMMRRKKLKK